MNSVDAGCAAADSVDDSGSGTAPASDAAEIDAEEDRNAVVADSQEF